MADGFLGRWSRRKQDVAAGKAVVEPPAPAPTLESGAASVPVQPGHAGRAGRAEAAAVIASTSAPRAASSPQPSAAQGRAVADAGDKPTPPPPTLADAQALTPASDFQPFVSRAVSPEVRNLAMKKLFADPHFNVMDGLDIYIGDYSQPDPLSPATLRQMASAHALGFFDHEKESPEDPEALEAPEGASTPAGVPGETMASDGLAAPIAPIAPIAGQPRDGAEAVASQDVAQSQVCNRIPRGAACDDAGDVSGEYPGEPFSQPGPATASAAEAVALPASHTDHDHDAHLRLQPDDAPQREGVGRGTA